MKKIILFSFLFISVLCLGQEHMKFRDLEINGDLTSFISELEKMDYSLSKTHDHVAILTGNFIGKNCTLFVVSSPNTETVWKVGVSLPKDENWSSLKSDYLSLQKQFTKKYGKPEKEYSFFLKPYYEGDGYEIQALRKEKCYFATIYKIETGYVILQISEFSNISISYEDKLNTEINKQETEQEVQDQI